MRTIDPIFLTTSIVKGFLGEKEHGFATGFFFSDSRSNVYLVTNKHVIYGDRYSEDGAKPVIDRIRLILHTNQGDLSQNTETTVSLLANRQKIWKAHSKRSVDLVCVPLAIDRKRFLFFTIGEDLLDSSNLQIGFEKIFIMGYPYAWYDTLNNLPVTRIGHLSSPFGVHFSGNPFMLGDVETHPGMSGSPVFMHLKDYMTIENNRLTTHLGATKLLLLGVFSGRPRWTVPDNKTGGQIDIPHSLSVIWFGDLIKEILAAA